MRRKIIHIDKEKCNGCGLCTNVCHEGAIEMIDGKATLIREDYCDGMGDCLPACPVGAISFTEREAATYDEQAVKKHLEERNKPAPKPVGCPGTVVREMKREVEPPIPVPGKSQLMQWPCQLKLVPVRAPFFQGAKLLVAADCSAFAFGDFHNRFMRNHVTVIGCPKLDGVDYSEKLMHIIRDNDIKSVTVVRMEVPCCGGLENSVKKALQESGKFIPWQVVTISTDGRILD